MVSHREREAGGSLWVSHYRTPGTPQLNTVAERRPLAYWCAVDASPPPGAQGRAFPWPLATWWERKGWRGCWQRGCNARYRAFMDGLCFPLETPGKKGLDCWQSPNFPGGPHSLCRTRTPAVPAQAGLPPPAAALRGAGGGGGWDSGGSQPFRAPGGLVSC